MPQAGVVMVGPARRKNAVCRVSVSVRGRVRVHQDRRPPASGAMAANAASRRYQREMIIREFRHQFDQVHPAEGCVDWDVDNRGHEQRAHASVHGTGEHQVGPVAKQCGNAGPCQKEQCRCHEELHHPKTAPKLPGCASGRWPERRIRDASRSARSSAVTSSSSKKSVRFRAETTRSGSRSGKKALA